MIVTAKVLGLQGVDRNTVTGAVWRVVDYLNGTPATGNNAAAAAVGVAVGGFAGYYPGWDGTGVGGVTRRCAAGPAGVTIGGGAAAGRSARGVGGAAGADGTSGRTVPRQRSRRGRSGCRWRTRQRSRGQRRYLRRLAARTATPTGTAATTGMVTVDDADSDPGVGRVGRDRLVAVRDDRDRWRVHRDELARFIADRDAPTVVLGFDLTAAAPKSVSVLWAFADPAVRGQIAASMNLAVDAAIAVLERHAAVGRVDGHHRQGVGFAGVSFLHELSRAQEPHLHVHTVVANGPDPPRRRRRHRRAGRGGTALPRTAPSVARTAPSVAPTARTPARPALWTAPPATGTSRRVAVGDGWGIVRG